MNKNRKVTQVYNPLPLKKTKVAIYCRVSTTHEDQAHSLANQISYYKAMVNRRLDWELVDIYADVKSGKNTSGRPEFKRMLEDCSSHKIDLIITKSISRFGRNTAETLAALNKLRNLIVHVIFENENINTQDTKQDFLIAILQTAAQAESEARSQNIKWGIANGLKSGKSKLYNRRCFGYSNNQNGDLIINEEEAETVRKVFDLYISGYSVLAIIRELACQGIKSPTGKERWSKRTVDTMLSNEKYAGNVLVGKTYCKDYPNNKRLFNNNREYPQYLVTGNHLAIITEDLFKRVQGEKFRRSNVHRDEEGSATRKATHYSMKNQMGKNNEDSPQ